MRYPILLAVASLWCLAAAPAIMAQTDFGLKGAGLEIGLVSPQDIDATFGFGVFADLGNITPQFMLETYVDYWSKSEDIVGGGETMVRDWAFGAKGKYVFPTENTRVRPFAGAGLGLHFVKAKVSISDMDFGGIIVPGMTVEDSMTKLGLDLGGGLTTPLSGRADFVGELWYGIVSDLNQLSLKVGVLYRLGI